MFQHLICWLIPTPPGSHLDEVKSTGWSTSIHPAVSPGAILGHINLPRDLAAKETSGEVPEVAPSPRILFTADLLSQIYRSAVYCTLALPRHFLGLFSF